MIVDDRKLLCCNSVRSTGDIQVVQAVDFDLSISYGRNHYSQNITNQIILHPRIYLVVFLGINYVSEMSFLGCGIDSTALRVQNAPQASVHFKWTLRKSKMKQNSWNVDPHDRGFHNKFSKDV